MMASARLFHSHLLTLMGRIAEAATQFDFIERAGSPPVRALVGWCQAGLLLLAGRWPEADEISCAALDRHSKISFSGPLGLGARGTAQAIRMQQRWAAAFLTGGGADMVDELRASVEATGTPISRGILTMALVEAGHSAEARVLLHSLPLGPKDYRWLPAQCWALLAAARLRDIELLNRLRDQLLPYRHLACAASMALVCGSVAYFTGEAALALGDPDTALADLTIAVEIDERMGARPWLARARDAITRAQRCADSGR